MTPVRDRGSASVYVVALAAAVAGLGLVLAGVGGALVAAARARTAADLAALAAAGRILTGADAACAAGRRIATANGARVDRCWVAPDATVTIEVVVRPAGWLSLGGVARAAARAGPAAPGTGSTAAGPVPKPGVTYRGDGDRRLGRNLRPPRSVEHKPA